ncbi:hypothetical protein WDV93_16805 [Pantoea ananatis]
MLTSQTASILRDFTYLIDQAALAAFFNPPAAARKVKGNWRLKVVFVSGHASRRALSPASASTATLPWSGARSDW